MSERENDPVLRQLELIDRILGLEAENAQLKIESAVRDLRHVRGSRSWKVGNFLLSPIVFTRKTISRIRHGK